MRETGRPDGNVADDRRVTADVADRVPCEGWGADCMAGFMGFCGCCHRLYVSCIVPCRFADPPLAIGSSDLTYHALWVVLAQTVDAYGIYECRQIDRGDAFGSSAEFEQTRMEVEALKGKVNDEALHGALRISALVSAAAQRGEQG
jgi:hypothetical protein